MSYVDAATASSSVPPLATSVLAPYDQIFDIEAVCNERCSLPNVGVLLDQDRNPLVIGLDDTLRRAATRPSSTFSGGGTNDGEPVKRPQRYLMYAVRCCTNILATVDVDLSDKSYMSCDAGIEKDDVSSSAEEIGRKRKKTAFVIPKSYTGWFLINDVSTESHSAPGSAAFQTIEEVVVSMAAQFLTCQPLAALQLPCNTASSANKRRPFADAKLQETVIAAGAVLSAGVVFADSETLLPPSTWSRWCCRSLVKEPASMRTPATKTETLLLHCIDVGGRHLLVPLTTNGRFYPVTFQECDNPSETDDDPGHSERLDTRCVYRIRDLINSGGTLPRHVTLVYGLVPQPPMSPGRWEGRLSVGSRLTLVACHQQKSLVTVLIPDGIHQRGVEKSIDKGADKGGGRVAGRLSSRKPMFVEFPSNCGVMFQIRRQPSSLTNGGSLGRLKLDNIAVRSLRYCHNNIERYKAEIQPLIDDDNNYDDHRQQVCDIHGDLTLSSSVDDKDYNSGKNFTDFRANRRIGHNSLDMASLAELSDNKYCAMPGRTPQGEVGRRRGRGFESWSHLEVVEEEDLVVYVSTEFTTRRSFKIRRKSEQTRAKVNSVSDLHLETECVSGDLAPCDTGVLDYNNKNYIITDFSDSNHDDICNDNPTKVHHQDCDNYCGDIRNEDTLNNCSDIFVDKSSDIHDDIDDDLCHYLVSDRNCLTDLDNAYDDGGYLIPLEYRTTTVAPLTTLISPPPMFCDVNNDVTIETSEKNFIDKNLAACFTSDNFDDTRHAENKDLTPQTLSGIDAQLEIVAPVPDRILDNLPQPKYDPERLESFLKDSVAEMSSRASRDLNEGGSERGERSGVLFRRSIADGAGSDMAMIPRARRRSAPCSIDVMTLELPRSHKDVDEYLERIFDFDGAHESPAEDMEDEDDVTDYSESGFGTARRSVSCDVIGEGIHGAGRILTQLPPGELCTWSVEEVQMALRYISMKDEIVVRFVCEQIDGKLLADVNDELLKEGFTEMSAWDRQKLIKFVQGWRPKRSPMFISKNI